MDDVIKYLGTSEFLESFIVVAVTIVLLKIIKNVFIKKVAYLEDNELEKKDRSFSGIVFGILQYVIAILAVFIVLIINNVNITAQLAGLGILATIVGLALQDSFNDVVQGMTIYNNNFYKVGDLVKYNCNYCIVKYFNVRVTKFTNIYTHATFTVCNSQIKDIEKVKNGFSKELIFKMSESKSTILECINEIVDKIGKLDGIDKAFCKGCSIFDTQGKHYYICIDAKPINYFKKTIEITDLILDVLEEHNVNLVTERYMYTGNNGKD